MAGSVSQWQRENGVSNDAFLELCALLFGSYTMQAGIAPEGKAESYVASAVRLEAGGFNVNLYRNNVGVLNNSQGTPVRYGLANTSKQVNSVLKSSDLVGWRSFVITPEMVGCVVAQFVCRETKEQGWTFSGDERETAQMNWINLVNNYGGDACFATGVGSFPPSPKLKRP